MEERAMRSCRWNILTTAAPLAVAVMVSGSVGHAANQFIGVKTPFQLDGDAMDSDPTSDVFPDGSDPNSEKVF